MAVQVTVVGGTLRIDAISIGARAGDVDTYAATNRARFQAAIDYLYALGGGIITASGVFRLSGGALVMKPGVWIEGPAPGFHTQFVNNGFTPFGLVLKLAAGANHNVIEFFDQINSVDHRCHSGLIRVFVDGHRSTSQDPTVRDVNTSGDCVRIKGARYIKIIDCVLARAPERGLNCVSHDYGAGAISANNIEVRGSAILSNFTAGAALTAGDSIFTGNQVGYNGGVGLDVTSWGIVSHNLIWNNKGAGVRDDSTGEPAKITDNKIYDNELSGVIVASTVVHADVTDNMILRNNVANNVSVIDQCGIYMAALGSGHNLSGNIIGDTGGSPKQKYGIYFADATTVADLDGNVFFSHVTQDIRTAADANILWHGYTGSTRGTHPGFKAVGSIDLNGNDLLNVDGLAGSAWLSVTSLSSGTLACAGSAFIGANVSGGGTVTDLTSTLGGIPVVIIRNLNASALVFQNSSTKLRNIGAADKSVAQHESITYAFVSGVIWQQIGGKQ